ncbi:Variable outer membrane protein (plasmid) [Borrelia hermsii MTW]|uniref:Variable large protein n=1 Tax=Borrelia hermsii MTW TaxID=1313291 RepID=W5TAX6_BORHE|nr:Variable outer membrane protein [Borrelia hermsii MTW]
MGLKDGKVANTSDADAQGIVATTVKGAAVSAVIKALDYTDYCNKENY